MLMRGASADSLAALTDELGRSGGVLSRLAARVTGDSSDGRTADDLFGAAAALRRETALRRTLTDGSLPSKPKVGLARQVFGGSLSSSSLDLVSSSVSRSWTVSRDLADALEHLGVVAVVREAEQGGEADALESELFAFGRLVAENAELRDALSDPARSTEDKQALVARLLEGRATSATVRLAQQSVTGTYRTVALAVEDYQRIAADHRERLVATVRVAHQLSDDDELRLAQALAGQYGRPVHLNTLVDPEVVGGMRVEIGDDVIDGTMSNRLDEARRRLAG